MSSNRRSRFSFIVHACCLLLACLAVPVAHAQVADSTGPSTVTSNAALDTERPPPLEPTRHRPSLKGARWEIAAGGLAVAAAPLVGLAGAFITGPQMFDCFLLEGDELHACQVEEERKRIRGRRVGISLGVLASVAGLSVMGHGAYRLKKLRERRGLAFTGVSLSLDESSAALSLGGAF